MPGDLAVVAVPDGGFVIAVLADDREGNLGVSWGDVYIYPRPKLLLLVQRECLRPGSGVLIGRHCADADAAYTMIEPSLLPGSLYH